MTDGRLGALDTSFERVFREHLGYVWNALRRLGVREADVPDLAHDVFLTFHRRRDAFDTTRPLRPWLFGIAARVASDHRKLARHQREELRADAEPGPGDDGEATVASRETRRLVLQALQRVDEERRAVLVMHDIEGHTMPEIVEALGIPLNTGYSRLRLARGEFAAAVRELDPEGTP